LRKQVEDAPPQGRRGEVIGQESCGSRRPHEQGGIEAGPSEVAQPFCQLWQEWVRGRIGNFCSEQLPPSPFCTGVRGGEPHVELLLPDSGGAAELGWVTSADVVFDPVSA
jgi:hypothetical protein